MRAKICLRWRTAWKGICTKRWDSSSSGRPRPRLPPILVKLETAALFCQFVSCEKETQLKTRRILSIGPVNRIVLNARRPLFADGAFLGVRRIRSAHQLAQIGNGVFLFESQSDNRSARHEPGERAIKWPARMHGVKLLRLMLRDFQHLHGENAEAILFKLFNDVANCVLDDRVGFHDGKSALQCLHNCRWSLILVRRFYLSVQIASSCPLGSTKWKRRPPGNSNIGLTILLPAAATLVCIPSISLA